MQNSSGPTPKIGDRVSCAPWADLSVSCLLCPGLPEILLFLQGPTGRHGAFSGLCNPLVVTSYTLDIAQEMQHSPADSYRGQKIGLCCLGFSHNTFRGMVLWLQKWQSPLSLPLTILPGLPLASRQWTVWSGGGETIRSLSSSYFFSPS